MGGVEKKGARCDFLSFQLHANDSLNDTFIPSHSLNVPTTRPANGQLVRWVNSYSPRHQKGGGGTASVIIQERRAAKSLATSKKHSSWSPICE